MPSSKADRVRRTPRASLLAQQPFANLQKVGHAQEIPPIEGIPPTGGVSTCADCERVGRPVPRRHRPLSETCSDSERLSRRDNCSSRERFSRLSGAAAAAFNNGQAAAPVSALESIQRLRRAAAAEVERLISLMDEIDADPDFEPSGDELEPSLGSCENHPSPVGGLFYGHDGISRSTAACQLGWAAGNADDRELCADLEEDDEHNGCEPDVDEEPSLGSTNPASTVSQAAWSQGTCDDCEDEHDGREASGDELEPSLGSFDRLVNQEHAYRQTHGGRNAIMFRNGDAELDVVL